MKILSAIIIFFFAAQLKGFSQLSPGNVDTQQLNVHPSIRDSNFQPMAGAEKRYQQALHTLLAGNRFLHLNQEPVLLLSTKRQPPGKEFVFYLLGITLLIFGFFRAFYSRYFHNIFRVFFNTSLRQNQLTDLLLQARLPSLIFNIFFSIFGGLYLWLLIPHFYPVSKTYNTRILFFCIITIDVICTFRFLILKFIGWITGLSTALNIYIFVIFLVNKIIGIALIPLILLLAFASPVFFNGIFILSLVSLSIFFLVRFFRSYSLLQQELNISMLRFLVYIISLEILPLLVIYKLSITFILNL